jgi:type III pantothenate kinase
LIIDIDIGNTRMKWRLCSAEGRVFKRGFALTSAVVSVGSLNALFAEESLLGLSHVRIATVVSSHNKYLAAWAKQYDIEPFFAITSACCAGVTNAYKAVAQMGVDRWLAAIAAYNQVGGACLVIDAGSALTVDVIQENGQHSGGYIVPGLEMMYRSLMGDTEQIVLSQVTGRRQYPLDPALSDNTQQAVLSGLPLMLLGLVSNVLLSTAGGRQSLSVLVAGGDGEYVAKLLQYHAVQNVEYVPELVMDGLSLAFNE